MIRADESLFSDPAHGGNGVEPHGRPGGQGLERENFLLLLFVVVGGFDPFVMAPELELAGFDVPQGLHVNGVYLVDVAEFRGGGEDTQGRLVLDEPDEVDSLSWSYVKGLPKVRGLGVDDVLHGGVEVKDV